MPRANLASSALQPEPVESLASRPAARPSAGPSQEHEVGSHPTDIPAPGEHSARPRRTPHPAPASPMRPATRSATRGTLTRSLPNEGGLLAQPSRRQCLLRCGVSVLSLEPLGAVGRLAPLDRVLRQRQRTDCDLEPRRGGRRSEWREKTEDWQVETGRGARFPLSCGQHVH